MIVKEDREQVADLDIRYQAAVKVNDAHTMDEILADDFVLVTGNGRTFTKDDLISEARSGRVRYTRQDASERTVRVWGDTAVVTARLSAAGVSEGNEFDYEVWYSDTYVRDGSEWRYVLGQASCRMPPENGGR